MNHYLLIFYEITILNTITDLEYSFFTFSNGFKVINTFKDNILYKRFIILLTMIKFNKKNFSNNFFNF